MPCATTTEIDLVAKKGNKQPPPSLPFERIEFQAPIGFTAMLDRTRKKRGLSRSAYIRQAVLLLMEEDNRR